MSLAEQQWCPTGVQVTVLQARGLRVKGKGGTNDAYALMQVGKEKYQTSVAEKCVAPVWKEEAAFELPPLLQGGGGAERSTLRVHVLHRALVGPDKLLGQAVISLLQLSEDKTRNKTEWFKLLDKTGKADKDRGEVLVDIQFMRDNMTGSMFDLSAAGKSRSRMGKFKDKVRGKKKELDAPSTVVPSITQILTDSEEEGNGDGEVAAGKGEKKKKHKMKSLFSPKSNLQKNMSQSMSVLPAKNSSLSGSQSSGLNVDSSEGKKKFKFMIHKRSGSSDSKDSSSGHQKQGAAEQSNLCINGSHVYCEEAQPRTSRISSNFSLASSGHGSMEDVPESSPPSVDSLKAVTQYSAWTEEEEEEETAEVENIKEDELRREEEERIRMVEERRKKEEEEERVRRKEEELERFAEEKRRREEEERRTEERVKREAEESMRMEEEERRRQEEERQRLAEEKRKLEEQEKRRIEEEEKMQREEDERIRVEEERVQEERRRREVEERARKQEEERKLEEKRRLEEEERRIEEEKIRKEEEERIRREEERAEEERRRREEEEMVRRQEEEREEKRKLEEQERRRREEEERIKNEEEKAMREQEERLAEEKRRLQEQERRRIEEEEKMQREEDERIRVEEERAQEERRRREVEERARKQEEERKLEKKRKLEEEERKRIEEEENIRRREEERLKVEEERRRKEDEERVKRQEEEREKLAEEKRILEQQRRIEEEDKRQREEEEKIRVEEERRKKKEEERIRMQEEEREKLAEEKRLLEEQERRRIEEEEKREEEERIRKEEERRRVEEERARKEEEENERLAEERRRLEEQEKRSIEEKERIRKEEKAEKERKEEEARKLEKKKLRDAEEQKKSENKTKQKAEGTKSKVATDSPAEVTSTNPFDENVSNNPFEENPDSPAGPDSKVSTIQQRCQSAVSSVGSKTVSTDEKDLISAQRERRLAPQPPGSNQAQSQSQKEQDGSAPYLAQINKHTKDKEVKTVSVLPQRSVQMISPLNRSPTDTKNTQSLMQSSTTKGMSNVAQPSKRPAPSRPRSVEEEPSLDPKTASHERGSQAKQVPIVYGLNPFEDDEDENELTAQDDTTSGNTGSIQCPPATSQAADKDVASKTKIKSSKMARAPQLPAEKAATSSTSINRNTEGDRGTDDTGVTVPDNRVTNACDPESEAIRPVHVQETPLQESQPVTVQSAGEEAGGKKQGPPTTSRRLQPVKPLNPLEQQSVSVVQGEKDNKITGILCEVQEKTKVTDTGLKGPFSQLTQEELISLVLKQENQLSQRDKKISELELYIDNLLVRVIEEKPSILMSMNSLKKAA